MNELIMHYCIPALYVAGLLVMVIRYHHTRAFVPGFIAFALLLMPFGFEWFSPRDARGASAAPPFLWIASFIGVLLIVGSVRKTADPKKTKAAAVFATVASVAILLLLLATSGIAIARGGAEFMHSALTITFWATVILAVLVVIGTFTDRSPQDTSLLQSLGGVLLIGIVLFVLVISAKSIYSLSHGSWWLVASRIEALVTGLAFAGCALAVLNRFGSTWYGVVGITAFGLLSLCDFVVFGMNVTSSAASPIVESALLTVFSAGWFLALTFLFAVPRDRVLDYPSWKGFRMTQTRWAGIAAIVVGALICAWQLYEVKGGEHFTFWIVGGFIPLPVILLGILLCLGGLIALI